MFLIDSENEQEGGRLRNGRRFQSGKRRRTMTRRGSCGTTGGQEYELASHLDVGSCDEEEKYQRVFEKEDEEEATYLEYEYNILITPHTYPQVRYRNSSPSGCINQSNNNNGNSRQGIPTRQTFNPTVPRTNIMVRNDIKLPIINGNGLEYPKQHWFLCKAMWTVRQIQDESIKKAQMIKMVRVVHWIGT